MDELLVAIKSMDIGCSIGLLLIVQTQTFAPQYQVQLFQIFKFSILKFSIIAEKISHGHVPSIVVVDELFRLLENFPHEDIFER